MFDGTISKDPLSEEKTLENTTESCLCNHEEKKQIKNEDTNVVEPIVTRAKALQEKSRPFSVHQRRELVKQARKKRRTEVQKKDTNVTDESCLNQVTKQAILI